ncbi:DUF7948 domain-containing protein [Taibaiella soli]|uniref:Uncharacterized protein n=1 Tax=Taibaiella soli TaxID=1649169 RepID=A0A2W2BEQ3_9BACT|nr:SBBP repeat-containing protein [Taibaiella soli]PZF72066.1 hypothetical protein DN068_14095 [Taibaiella soli]
MIRSKYFPLVLLFSGMFSTQNDVLAQESNPFPSSNVPFPSGIMKPNLQPGTFGEAFGFIENKGQIKDQSGKNRKDVQFKLSAENVNVFISNGALHYQWTVKNGEKTNIYRMDMLLAGANKHAKMERSGVQQYHESYVSKGKTMDIAAYEKIVYKNIYHNIDWQLYLKDGHMEYDFVVHPGGNVSDIQLSYNGASDLQKQTDGGLRVTTPMGYVTEQSPYSYTTNGYGESKTVASNFSVKGNTVSFNTDKYEGTLIIDPILQWATYYGGNNPENGYAVATDAAGNVYLTGYTSSTTNIATAGAYLSTYVAGNDVFLAKFNSAGARIWGTYFGGVNGDQANAITCDKWGNVYLAGNTTSGSGSGFPVTASSAQSSFGGGTDAFLAKFDTAGNFKWTTYYGGTGTDYGYCVKVTDSGTVYFSGTTTSPNNMSTPGSFKDTLSTGLNTSDAFLAKFDTAGVRQWGTYYGGNDYEDSRAIAIDDSGNVYMSGTTRSVMGIATANAFQTSFAGTLPYGNDAFLAKFTSAGTRVWGTYFGGLGNDAAAGVSYGNGLVNMVGSTSSASAGTSTYWSAGLATTGAYQDTQRGNGDAFIAQFDVNGARTWSTYVGGEGADAANGVYADGIGNIYVVGQTKSKTGMFPTPGVLRDTFTGNPNLGNDIFLAKFNNQGVRQWGTYYGGTMEDVGRAIAGLASAGTVYFSGVTSSVTGMATANGFQPVQSNNPSGNNQDAFLVKLFECPPVQKPDTIVGIDSICPLSTITLTTPKQPTATAYIWTLPNGWTGTSDSNSITVTATQSGGFITVKAANFCDTSAADSMSVYVYMVAPAVITVNGFVLGTASSYATYQWILNNGVIPGATNATYTVTQNGNYSVAVTSPQGCVDTSVAYVVTNVGVNNINPIAAQVSIFPNPAKDVVNIYAPVKVNATLTDVAGKVIKTQNNVQSISVNELAEGVYLLRLTDANGTFIKVEKIIKQNK